MEVVTHLSTIVTAIYSSMSSSFATRDSPLCWWVELVMEAYNIPAYHQSPSTMQNTYTSGGSTSSSTPATDTYRLHSDTLLHFYKEVDLCWGGEWVSTGSIVIYWQHNLSIKEQYSFENLSKETRQWRPPYGLSNSLDHPSSICRRNADWLLRTWCRSETASTKRATINKYLLE